MYKYKQIDVNCSEKMINELCDLENKSDLEPFTKEEIMHILKYHYCFACLDNDRIVGYISVLKKSRYFYGSYYISSLNIIKPYQRKKIATTLLGLVEQFCLKDNENNIISLDVFYENFAAINLYLNNGFVISNEKSLNSDNDIVMYKYLHNKKI